jgi:hypothetical protein
MFPPGVVLMTASRTLVISGGGARSKRCGVTTPASAALAVCPTFLGRLSRFRLSNLPDEARFAANRTVKCAGHINDNKLGRKP